MSELGKLLPKYKCHKEVYALKIGRLDLSESELGGLYGRYLLTPEDTEYAPFEVEAEYVEKHKPSVGGYWVRYEGGYESFSPAEAFESGYTLI